MIRDRITGLIRLLFLLLYAGAYLALFSACDSAPNNTQHLHELYDYRDTRKIVCILLDAEKQLSEKGPSAFNSFHKNKNRWYYKDAYLYVYATNGTCLFHGGIPELEGQQLHDIVDAEGRELLSMVHAAALDPENPHGWVHYYWNIPNRLYPVWKSSCHRVVTLPDGEQVLLGIGLAKLPQERDFVKFAVDSAVRLLKKKGSAALEALQDPLSMYNLPGSPIFIVTEKGDTIIAPTFRTGYSRNILDYEDDAGHTPLKDAIDRLQDTDHTWVVLLVHNPLSMNLQKMGLYMRKAKMGEQVVYVGAPSELPKPSWMK